MKKLLIILAMIFIGCSESGNSVAALDFDQTDVENDSTEIDSIVTIDTIDIDSVKETKDTIINTKKNNRNEESSNSNEVTSSSSKVEDKSSSSINDKKEESSSSMEKKNESSSSEKVVLSSSSSKENVVSSSSELIVSSSSEKKVESSSSSKIVESSSSEKIVNSSSSVNDDYIDENEPKRTDYHSYIELDELKLNWFRVENNIAYLSWKNNTDYTMQINVTYRIGCNLVGVSDSTIMYTIKANSDKEKAIYEIKNNAKKCVGEIKSITATKNDKSNFAGWEWGSDRGIEQILFGN